LLLSSNAVSILIVGGIRRGHRSRRRPSPPRHTPAWARLRLDDARLLLLYIRHVSCTAISLHYSNATRLPTSQAQTDAASLVSGAVWFTRCHLG
jgi:hypothetical protein